MKETVEKVEYYFSAMYGGGVYRSDRKDGQNPVLTNVFNKKQYTLRGVRMPAEQAFQLYANRIQKPPRPGILFWPVDLVFLSGKQRQQVSHFVECRYDSAYPDAPHLEQSIPYALLFPFNPAAHLSGGEDRVSRIHPRSWKNPEIQRIACQLSEALHKLNQDGYFYNEFNLSRLIFSDDGSLYLDYSPFVCSGEDLRGERGGTLRRANADYPIEYADPSVIRGIIPAPDFQSQNYSLSAFLFALFFHRFPYDGRILSGMPDYGATKWDHMLKFRDYHRNPVFVFDTDGVDNSLGYFTEDSQVIDLWNEFPDALKDLFFRALPKDIAERAVPTDVPSAGEWANTMREVGWNH